MGSGFNFFTNAIDKTPSTTESWQDIDVSADGVPSGASGVILLLIYKGGSTGNKTIQVRKKGSTDDDTTHCGLDAYAKYIYAFVGIDSNRKLQAYIKDSYCYVYLLGYTENDDVVFFTNEKDYSVETYDQWVDVDVSSDVPSGATGVIVRIQTTGGNEDPVCGVRKNDSTDDTEVKGRIYDHNSTYSYIYALCGVDTSRIFEHYADSANVKLYLVGYTKGSKITFKTNVDDVSLGDGETGGWYDKDITSETASDADGAIIIIRNKTTGQGTQYEAVRKNGSTDTESYKKNIQGGMLHSAIGLDSSQIFEGYVDANTIDFYLIGYCKPAAAGETYTKTWQIDTLFKKLGITRTTVVDAAFKKPNITKALAVDSAFQKTAQIQKQLDSLFKKPDTPKTFNIDSGFLKHNIVKSFAVDARFGAIATHTISTQINTLLKKHNIPKTFAIDTYIGEVSAQTHTKTIGIDTIFSYKVKLPPILGITLDGQLVIPVKKEIWIRN